MAVEEALVFFSTWSYLDFLCPSTATTTKKKEKKNHNYGHEVLGD